MEISGMGNASLMLGASTAALKKAIDSSEEAITQVIEAISSGEVDGTSSLDIYA